MPVEEEHLKGGKDYSAREYCVVASRDEAAMRYAMELARTAEVCVCGACSLEYAVERAKLPDCGLSFEFGERWLKRGWINVLSPHLRKWWWAYQTYFDSKPFYKLNASAFAASDHRKLHTYRGRCYKWGYFTVVEDRMMPEKAKVEASLDVQSYRIVPTLMWCARFLRWKHPELPVLLAERLRAKGYDFRLDFYGSGDDEEPTWELVAAKGLSDRVTFHGAVPNEQVLAAMAQHDIFLFTSDSNEGWGAVANESMSQGCVLVGSDAIGSVPYLVRDGVNGRIFKNSDVEDLTRKVEWLLLHPREMGEMRHNAVKTMREVWSPRNAASNFMRLLDELRNHRECSVKEGPGSKES